MRKTIEFVASLALILLASCHTLRKSDIKTVKAYADATHRISEVPAAVYKEYYSLREESLLLKNSVSFACDDDFKKNIKKTEQAYEAITDNSKIVNGYKASFSVLTSFSELILALTDSKYRSEFVKQDELFKVEFDSLISKHNALRPTHTIPPSITNVVTKAINFLAETAIKSKQRKYLIELLTDIQQPLDELTTFYVAEVGPEIKERINKLDSELKDDFDTYITNLKGCDSSRYHDPMLYKEKIIPVYLDWKLREKKLAQLAESSIKGMQQVSDGCRKLLTALKEKTSIKDLVTELKDLYTAANDIRNAYSTYADDLKKLKEQTQPKN